MEYISYKNNPSMPCIVALRMTSSLPLLFKQFKYMDSYYIDGGLYDHFPITHNLKDNSQDRSRRLGIMIDDNFYDTCKSLDQTNILEYICNLLNISMRQYLKMQLDSVQHIDIVKIDTGTNPFYFSIDTKTKMELFSIGYNHAKSFFSNT